MKKNLFFSLLLTAAVLCLAGCSLLGSAGVILQLPPADAAHSGSILKINSWMVEYPVSIEDGIPVYEQSEFSAAGSGLSEIRIPVARGVNLPVLARPVYSFGGRRISGNYPAGAVYPADIEGGILALEWRHGLACIILKRCLMNSDMVRGFDTEGFREALLEKSSEYTDEEGGSLPGGVWLTDPDPIISRLGYGLFRTSSIRAAETMSFSIPAGPGTYVSDNPFYPTVEPADGLIELTVAEQLRTAFFNIDSESEFIELYFDESFWCWLKPFTGESGSGRM